MKKVWRSSKRIVHAIAYCHDCKFNDDGQHTASREATKHSRRTGHTVAVELGISYSVMAKV